MGEIELLKRIAAGVSLETAAVILALSLAGYVAVKTVRLRKLGLHRRKEDPRIEALQKAKNQIETAARDLEKKLEDEVKRLHEQIGTAEGVARNAVARVEQLGESFEGLEGYVHEAVHGLRNELQNMTRAISNVESTMNRAIGNVEGAMSQLSANVGRVVGVLMAK